MRDLRRITAIAVFLIVALRVAIGWQFLYEGLWKLSTQNSPKPWSAEGYLKSAQGPFRGAFYELAGDEPFDLNWLDYNKVSKDWDAWHKRFINHYPKLSDNQKALLNEKVNGKKKHVAKLSALPDGIDFKADGQDKHIKKAVSYDKEKKLLVVDGSWHITPRERELLFRMVPEVKMVDGKPTGGTELQREFYDAVDKVYKRQSRLAYKEKLAASLRGDEERIGAILEKRKGVDPFKSFGDFKRFGKIDEYRIKVAEYKKEQNSVETEFDQTHLKHSWDEIVAMRTELVGPVKAMDAELKEQARDLLSPGQMASGRVPAGFKALPISNWLTIIGLLVLGACLMMGFFTRTAAFFGAIMLFSFYLVSPPWPGVPPAPGPEHSLFVNKNLIEVIALLAIMFVPSGIWFGVDGLIKYLRRNKTANKSVAGGKNQPLPSGVAVAK